MDRLRVYSYVLVTWVYSIVRGGPIWGALLIACSLAASTHALAHPVTVQWDPNPEADLSGYFLHYGSSPRQYTARLVVGSDACEGGACSMALDLDSGHWYFAVSAFDIWGAESELSDEIHAFLGTEEPVVLYPDGAIKWVKGCTYEILWENFTGATVGLQLLRDGRVDRKIASSAQNSGRYAWAVPQRQRSGSGFRIKVISGSESDESDEPFSIVAPAVLYPGASSVMNRGEVETIAWDRETFCGGDVRISLCQGKKEVLVIGPSVPNTGFYEWLVPVDLKQGKKYRIRVRSSSHSECYGDSNGSFSIQ